MNKLTANTQRPNSLHYAIFQSSDRDCMFVGAKHWDVSKSDKYRQVCSVNFFGGLQLEGHDWYVDNKEDVFAILNGAYANDETGEDVVYEHHVVGYGIVEGTRKDGSEYCFRDMHSLSVGDIVVDHSDEDGKAFIVDSFGFKEIEFTGEMQERFVPKYEACLLYTSPSPRDQA